MRSTLANALTFGGEFRSTADGKTGLCQPGIRGQTGRRIPDVLQRRKKRVTHDRHCPHEGLKWHLDGKNCTWSSSCIGMPSVIRVKDRLAVLYDAPGGNSVDHMRRDIGLAWLKLPLISPADPEGEQKQNTISAKP